MRWFTRSLIILALAWAIFAISPYVALYSFAKAVEARDMAAIEQRVNFHAVRISIARQLVTSYLMATGREDELKGMGGRLVVGAGATVADPIVAEYVSPEALIRLLNEQGSPAASGQSTNAQSSVSLNSFASLGNAWQLFVGAQSHGFRAVSFALPVNKPANEQFRLQFRLSGTDWRIVGVELPKAMEQRLVQELIRRNPSQT